MEPPPPDRSHYLGASAQPAATDPPEVVTLRLPKGHRTRLSVMTSAASREIGRRVSRNDFTAALIWLALEDRATWDRLVERLRHRRP